MEADRLALLDLWTKVHSTVNLSFFHKRQPELRERSLVGPRPASKSEGTYHDSTLLSAASAVSDTATFATLGISHFLTYKDTKRFFVTIKH